MYNSIGACGFRQGRRCMDQVFAIRQEREKYRQNGKDVFWELIDLEKAYDTIDRHDMWQMLRVYGVGGKLLKAVQSFYIDRTAFCTPTSSGWEMM